MTALPWDVAPEPMREDVEVYTLVVDANGEVTADCGILGRSDDENEAHAWPRNDTLARESDPRLPRPGRDL